MKIVTQLGWMIHRDSQEGLTMFCYENCHRIQKYVPSIFFSIRLFFAYCHVSMFLTCSSLSTIQSVAIRPLGYKFLAAVSTTWLIRCKSQFISFCAADLYCVFDYSSIVYLHCKSIYVYCVICTNYSQRNIVLSMQEHLCLVLEELNKRWAHQFKVFSEKIESDPRFSRFWKINVASHQMDLRHRNFYEERKSRTSTISSQCYI